MLIYCKRCKAHQEAAIKAVELEDTLSIVYELFCTHKVFVGYQFEKSQDNGVGKWVECDCVHY